MKNLTASVRIIVNSRGVDRVQLCGASWNDEKAATRIWKRIKKLVEEIDNVMKGK